MHAIRKGRKKHTVMGLVVEAALEMYFAVHTVKGKRTHKTTPKSSYCEDGGLIAAQDGTE